MAEIVTGVILSGPSTTDAGNTYTGNFQLTARPGSDVDYNSTPGIGLFKGDLYGLLTLQSPGYANISFASGPQDASFYFLGNSVTIYAPVDNSDELGADPLVLAQLSGLFPNPDNLQESLAVLRSNTAPLSGYWATENSNGQPAYQGEVHRIAFQVQEVPDNQVPEVSSGFATGAGLAGLFVVVALRDKIRGAFRSAAHSADVAKENVLEFVTPNRGLQTLGI